MHDAVGRAVRVGFEIEDLGLQQDRLLELVEAELLRRRDFDVQDVAAHLLDHDLVLQQLLAHAVGLGVGAVDLVDRDDRSARPAALAWRMASIVCGLTPSSAATTSTTMSVTLAPRARIAVKAWWPGVSMKVMRWPPFSTTW